MMVIYAFPRLESKKLEAVHQVHSYIAVLRVDAVTTISTTQDQA